MGIPDAAGRFTPESNSLTAIMAIVEPDFRNRLIMVGADHFVRSVCITACFHDTSSKVHGSYQRHP